MAASLARPEPSGDSTFARVVGTVTSSRVLSGLLVFVLGAAWAFHLRLTSVEQAQASLTQHGSPALTAHLAQEAQTSEQIARLDERVRSLQSEMAELRQDVKTALRRR